MRRHGILLAGLLAACGSADRAATLAVTRDSAGIRIVENPAPTEGAPDAVTLSTEPMLVLGRIDGDSAQQFAQLGTALRPRPNLLLTADTKLIEIRKFDSTGRFIGMVGRQGEGPGEYQHIDGLQLTPDGVLAVWDRVRHWFLFFKVDGDEAGTLEVDRPLIPSRQGQPPQPSRLGLLGFLADGGVLMTTGAPGGDGSGTFPVPGTLWVVGHDGVPALRDSVVWSHLFVLEDGENIRLGRPPFDATAAVAVADSGWLVTDGEHFEVRRMSSKGEGVQIVRSGRPRLAVRDDQRRHEIDRRLAQVRNEEVAGVRRALEFATTPDSMPAYDQLAVDRTGVIWARVFPDTLATASWDLFAPDGKLLGTAHLPSDLVVRDIDADHLLAQRKGDMDEPLVLLYRLTRRSGP